MDDTTWARGRGWPLCFGLTAEHYYRGGKNPYSRRSDTGRWRKFWPSTRAGSTTPDHS
ncbi:hypothetical protein ACFYO2_04565 [Streptomyces sp. NPDC006602]|uniref:hypothetical protein n=1 Tax=Streptomyces sp. NPDC006602 TaxID=3364751 RepID=UPI003676EE05